MERKAANRERAILWATGIAVMVVCGPMGPAVWGQEGATVPSVESQQQTEYAGHGQMEAESLIVMRREAEPNAAQDVNGMSLLRSEKVTGPYQPCPRHPAWAPTEGPLKGADQADLIGLSQGPVWAVLAGVRGVVGSLMGHETFLVPVRWADDWLVLGLGEGPLPLEDARPNLPWSPLSEEPPRDDFDTGGLAFCWNTYGSPADSSWWSLSATGQGLSSDNIADFDWFEYEGK